MTSQKLQRCVNAKQPGMTRIKTSAELKLARLPLCLALPIAPLSFISEIPFLSSCFPDSKYLRVLRGEEDYFGEVAKTSPAHSNDSGIYGALPIFRMCWACFRPSPKYPRDFTTEDAEDTKSRKSYADPHRFGMRVSSFLRPSTFGLRHFQNIRDIGVIRG